MATPESRLSENQTAMVASRGAAMKLPLGFLFLGLLVGDMAGLTSESLVSKLIALLFALFGGSIVLLFRKFSPLERSEIGILLLFISLGMIIGVHAGILTSQYRLLSPKLTGQVTKTEASVPPASTATAQPEVKPPGEPREVIQPPAKGTEQPRPAPSVEVPKCPDEVAYLKGKYTTGIANIDSRYSAKVIDGDEAYSELKSLIEGMRK